MKDYSDAIEFMKSEMTKQTEPFHRFYLAAIEAMEIVTPMEPVRDDAYIHCPGCGKEYTYRNNSEIVCGKRICNACGQHMAWGKGSEEDDGSKTRRII